MKITTRKIELTVEHSETYLIRRRTRIFALCAKCGREVQMLSPESAADAAGVSSQKIYALIKTNQIHFSVTENGHLSICFDSLSGVK